MKKLKKNIYLFSILIVIFSIFTVYSNANMPMVIKEITDSITEKQYIIFQAVSIIWYMYLLFSLNIIASFIILGTNIISILIP